MIISGVAVISRRNFRFFQSKFLFLLILAGCLAATASVGLGQTPAARPIARLISASQPVRVVVPERARMVTATDLARAANEPVPVTATSLERRAFELINAERIANGEEPLAWDEDLHRVAQQHSENMARLNFFDHVDPEGRDMVARAKGVKGWSALGENIAYNLGYDDPAAFAVERWMLSIKHRRNILNAGFTRSGLGVARAADGSVFFTQVFMTR